MAYQPNPKNHPKKSKLFQVPQLQFFQKVALVVPEQFMAGLPKVIHPDLAATLYTDLHELFWTLRDEHVISLALPFMVEYESVPTNSVALFYGKHNSLRVQLGYLLHALYSETLGEVVLLWCEPLPLNHTLFQKDAKIREVL